MKTFPHYYALKLIFMKAALQMPSKDALASLYANTAHAKLNTNNDFFLLDEHTLWLVLEYGPKQ